MYGVSVRALPLPSSPGCVCCPSPHRYENTERRKARVEAKGLRYMGMGVSGGEEGARRGEEANSSSTQAQQSCD
jgi:3-hydroxyisobutyrate dehydrogenase-like beta-hydroxyacid dehydrogenase